MHSTVRSPSGSFRVLVHQFRNHPGRDFFLLTAREGRPPGKQKRLRERVVALRKQNLSVHDISHSLSRDGEPLSPAALAAVGEERSPGAGSSPAQGGLCGGSRLRPADGA